MGLFSKKDKKPAANLSSKSRLDVKVKKDGAEYTFLLEGRLDTITSPTLESKIKEATPDATKLVLDLSKLDYISRIQRFIQHRIIYTPAYIAENSSRDYRVSISSRYMY